MTRSFKLMTAALVAITAAACSDTSSISDGSFVLSGVTSSFNYTPAGFSSTENSFLGADSVWGAHGEDHHDGRGHGGPGQRGFGPGGFGLGGLMGGGLHDLFRGIGFGPGFGHGRRGDDHCESTTRANLTITCAITYSDANGATQTAFDSLTTNTINTKIAVSGSITRRDSSVTTVANASDRTVTGLKPGSTQRTINGTSAGNEQTAGKDTAGTFTVKRVFGDTIKAVVVPVPTTSGRPPFPTSGTVIRSANISVTRASGTTSSVRREVVTYDGSSTAKVTITQDGTTKSCTVELPHGRLQCS